MLRVATFKGGQEHLFPVSPRAIAPTDYRQRPALDLHDPRCSRHSGEGAARWKPSTADGILRAGCPQRMLIQTTGGAEKMAERAPESQERTATTGTHAGGEPSCSGTSDGTRGATADPTPPVTDTTVAAATSIGTIWDRIKITRSCSGPLAYLALAFTLLPGGERRRIGEADFECR
jgi:hypothetical protein